MFQHRFILTFGFLITMGWLSMAPVRTPAAPGREKKQSPEAAPQRVIKSEANVVLVDAVVTDKKRNYLKDLTQKEFHVFEDGVEQNIVSFTREADIQPVTPGPEGYEHEADIKPVASARPRYMVLFFDTTSMEPDVQLYERNQAAKFVENMSSLNRMVAVMDFGSALQLAQDFTANRELLKSAVSKIKFAALQTNPTLQTNPSAAAMAGPGANAAKEEADSAFRNLMRAMRDVAKMLGTLPGRKSMIFLSAGFDFPFDPFRASRQADFQDAIDALNKANVGVYPVSAHGLASPVSRGGREADHLTDLQQVFYAMASQTGGFPVLNTNDLAAGMERVSEEMDECYVLGYVPPHPAHDGRYHKIHVKVDRAGTEVRARNGYSDTKGPNLLAGKPEGNVLESKAASFEAGEIPVTLNTPYFYVGPGIARVNLALSIPGSAIEFAKRGDNFQSQVNVLGIAYRDDGSLAARFSDTVSLNYEKDEKQAATKTFFDYQNSFKIAPGEYTFKLVLSAGGEKFGKYVVPLLVDPFSGKQLTLSGPAFGDKIFPAPLASADVDQTLIEGSAPLVANGAQVVPSSNNRFKKGTQPVVYVELFQPFLESSQPEVGILFDIVNRGTKEKVYSSDTLQINQYEHSGHPMLPVIFKLPMDKLPPGDYRIEIQGRDSSGNTSPVRTGDFSIE